MNTATRAVVVLLCAVCYGCWISNDDPPHGTKGACNNNGVCEVEQFEDCEDCNADCPCCRAIQALVLADVQDPKKATGDKDGQFALLGKDTVLLLELGREIHNDPEGGTDFMLVGQVLTDSSVSMNTNTCPDGAPAGDGYVVEVSASSSGPYVQIGYWTKTRTPPPAAGSDMLFKLACGNPGIPAARWVRLTPLGINPAARLDALIATSCEP